MGETASRCFPALLSLHVHMDGSGPQSSNGRQCELTMAHMPARTSAFFESNSGCVIKPLSNRDLSSVSFCSAVGPSRSMTAGIPTEAMTTGAAASAPADAPAGATNTISNRRSPCTYLLEMF